MRLLCSCRPHQDCHADVLIRLFRREFLPRRIIYIGSGSQLQKQRTKWASPFQPGFSYTYEECALQYARWLRCPDQAWLLAQVGSLRGCALACECPPGQPCHGEVLSAAAAEAPQQPASEDEPLPSSPAVHLRSDHWGHERASQEASCRLLGQDKPQSPASSQCSSRDHSHSGSDAVGRRRASRLPSGPCSRRGLSPLSFPSSRTFCCRSHSDCTRTFLEAQGLPSWGPHAPVIITSYSKGRCQVREWNPGRAPLLRQGPRPACQHGPQQGEPPPAGAGGSGRPLSA